MIELKITLPDWASEYIQEQIAEGRYASADELLTDLIDRARAVTAEDLVAELILGGKKPEEATRDEKAKIRAATQRLTELIREGIESGEGEEVTDDYWDRIDEQLQAELRRRQSA